MKKQIMIDGNNMQEILNTVAQTKGAMLNFAEKTWGEKPTREKVRVDVSQLFGPLVRILEKYTDFVEVQR